MLSVSNLSAYRYLEGFIRSVLRLANAYWSPYSTFGNSVMTMTVWLRWFSCTLLAYSRNHIALGDFTADFPIGYIFTPPTHSLLRNRFGHVYYRRRTHVIEDQLRRKQMQMARNYSQLDHVWRNWLISSTMPPRFLSSGKGETKQRGPGDMLSFSAISGCNALALGIT